jgi:hypothetical protein
VGEQFADVAEKIVQVPALRVQELPHSAFLAEVERMLAARAMFSDEDAGFTFMTMVA